MPNNDDDDDDDAIQISFYANFCYVTTLTLRLYRIERFEVILIESLKVRVTQSRHRQWLQVQQLGRRRILLRKDQMMK